MDSNIKVASGYDFDTTLKKLEVAIGESDLKIVSRINAQENLMKIGKEIGGNQIFELFNPNLASEVFEKNRDAGIIPPVRLYVYQNDSGSVIIYQDSARLFSEYELPDLGRRVNDMVQEIVRKAIS